MAVSTEGEKFTLSSESLAKLEAIRDRLLEHSYRLKDSHLHELYQYLAMVLNEEIESDGLHTG